MAKTFVVDETASLWLLSFQFPKNFVDMKLEYDTLLERLEKKHIFMVFWSICNLRMLYYNTRGWGTQPLVTFSLKVCTTHRVTDDNICALNMCEICKLILNG